MASGAPFIDLAVAGAGAPPSVILHGPGGRTVTPVVLGPGTTPRPATPRSRCRHQGQHHLRDVRHPGGGTWTVSPAPGSSPITKVRGPRLRAGHGRARGSAAAARTGAAVHDRHSCRRDGQLRRARRREYQAARQRPRRARDGALHPRRRPGRNRQVKAIVSLNGIAHQTIVVGHYRASAAPLTRAGSSGLRVRHHGRRFTISFAAGPARPTTCSPCTPPTAAACCGSSARGSATGHAGRRSATTTACGRRWSGSRRSAATAAPPRRTPELATRPGRASPDCTRRHGSVTELARRRSCSVTTAGAIIDGMATVEQKICCRAPGPGAAGRAGAARTDLRGVRLYLHPPDVGGEPVSLCGSTSTMRRRCEEVILIDAPHPSQPPEPSR